MALLNFVISLKETDMSDLNQAAEILRGEIKSYQQLVEENTAKIDILQEVLNKIAPCNGAKLVEVKAKSGKPKKIGTSTKARRKYWVIATKVANCLRSGEATDKKEAVAKLVKANALFGCKESSYVQFCQPSWLGQELHDEIFRGTRYVES